MLYIKKLLKPVKHKNLQICIKPQKMYQAISIHSADVATIVL